MNRPAPENADVLAADPRWALFLDVDGTLIHLAQTPDGAAPGGEVVGLLSRLRAGLGGAVALISGRRIANLDRLFAPLELPAAGLHGLEHRDARGCLKILGEAAALDHLRAPLRALAESHPGLLLEDKGRALAFHYRQAPEQGPRVEKAIADMVARSPDLTPIHGKMVVEVKPRHADKGFAVRAFMAEAPFRDRIPVFLGDDVTDEDGFRAVNERDGISIHVGHDGAVPRTMARYRLKNVGRALHWLAKIADSLESSAEEQGS